MLQKNYKTQLLKLTVSSKQISLSVVRRSWFVSR